MTNQKVGGWSTFRKVTKSDREALDKALGRIDLAPVEPLMVAEQIVSGQNYLFVCNGKNADFPVIIAVYAEPGGEVKVDTKEPGQIFEQFNLK